MDVTVGLPGGDAPAAEDLTDVSEPGRVWKHADSHRQDGGDEEEVS